MGLYPFGNLRPWAGCLSLDLTEVQMAFDQAQLVLQFCYTVAVLWLAAAIGMKVNRMLTKPRGTYGKGMPERRKRRRIVLPDPATMRPRLVAPGERI